MKAGIILLLGAAVVTLYLVFNSSQSSNPLSSQPSILQRLFPGTAGTASGVNPSPLTNRNLLPANYTMPQLSQSPVGATASYVLAGASVFSAFANLFKGSPGRTPTPAQYAGGNGVGDTGTISSDIGGLLQGPTPSGTPLSVSSGWVPTDSVIANVDLVPPVDVAIGPTISFPSADNLGDSSVIATPSYNDPVLSTPLYDDPTLATASGYDLTSTYPGYDSTIPVDSGVVSLPDSTTPDTIVV